MKSVSEAYKTAMKQSLRNPSHARIVLQILDVTAPDDGSWTASSSETYSKLTTLDYDKAYRNTITTLELNRWTLDGSNAFYNGFSADDGYLSGVMSDDEGLFTSAPTLTREFSAIHQVAGLSIYFDTRKNEWPVSLTVEFYLSGVLVDTLTINHQTTSFATVEHAVAQYDKIVIYPAVVLPYHRFRVEGIRFGLTRVFENDEILSTSQHHDVDPISRRLPIEELSFTIIDFDHHYDPDNPQGLYAYVEENTPVSIAFGYEIDEDTTEWLDPDTYLLNGRPTVQNERVTFNATGLISTLNGTYYKSVVGSKTLYSMAENVLLDANLPLTATGAHPWEIDSSLTGMTSTVVLPIDSHKNSLQRIAHAACCRLYTDYNNIIHIKPFVQTMVGLYDNTTSDNGHEDFSEWNSTIMGSATVRSYATLELNRWVLEDEDNTQVILPDSSAPGYGYIGDELSDDEGAFDTDPVITRIFNDYNDLSALRISFDVGEDEWPRSLTVDYYHDSTLVDSETVTDIDMPEICITNDSATSVNKTVITVLSASPYRRTRITKMYYRANDFSLDFGTILEKTQVVSKTDKLKAIDVTQYGYTVETSSTLYEETTTETDLHVELSEAAQNVSISVSGGTVTSSAIYGRAVDMTLTSGSKTVTITGKALTENTSVTTTSVNASGEVDIEENPVITNEALRSALAAELVRYLSMRNTYDVEYRGNPELETGDVIGMQTSYTNDMPVMVLTNDLTFNGGLRGRCKVKGLI